MTGNEIYYLALALLGEPSASAGDYETEVVRQKINILLPEVFLYNENYRAHAGKEPLVVCPTIAALSDEIPFEDMICRLALPYGLASKLAYDDDETGKASYFNGMMASVLQTMTPFISNGVVDLY